MRLICKSLLAIMLAGHAAGAFAQYIWLNEKGRKQYSDSPPPASVPKNRILKDTPDMPSYPPGISSTTWANGDKAASAPAASAPGTDEQNAAFNRRRAERESLEKQEEEAARQAAEKEKRAAQESGTRHMNGRRAR